MYDASVKRFQDLEHFTDRDVEAALRRNDTAELQLVPIIVALLAPDRTAAEAVCITLCSHEHYKVRAHALISLGHLARRFRVLDEKTVALEDRDDYVRAHARSAETRSTSFSTGISRGIHNGQKQNRFE